MDQHIYTVYVMVVVTDVRSRDVRGVHTRQNTVRVMEEVLDASGMDVVRVLYPILVTAGVMVEVVDVSIQTAQRELDKASIFA